jgi:hypothetical protein
MALVVFDRVQETTATTGTGTITLGGAVTGYQSFAVVGDGNTTFYCITNGAQWEVGIGTYTSSGTTLARTTVLSNSNGNISPITLVGASNVFVTYPSEKSVNLNASGNVSPLGTITSGVWNGTTIPVAYGGTGVTSSSGADSVVLRDANANVNFNNFIAGAVVTTASAGTTVLTVASKRTEILVGTTTHTFQLPDATTLQLGQSFIFVNNSSGLLTVTNNASATLDIVPSGGVVQLGATSIATNAGTWGIYSFLPGTYNFSIPTADFGNADITNADWQGDTIQPAYGGTGLTTFAAANNALYSTGASTLTAGTLPVAAGGTGLTTLASGRVPYGNGTGAISSSSTFVFDGTNLGIGTASPTAYGPGYTTLDINGSQQGTVLCGANGAPEATFFATATEGGIGTLNSIPLRFFTNATEAMRITSAGDIGISDGTSSIQTNSLTISKSIGNGAISGQANSTPDAANQRLFLVGFGSDADPYKARIEARSSAAWTDGTSTPTYLTLFTTPSGSATAVERMRITSTGDVGIGTAGAPTAGFRLDIRDATARQRIESTTGTNEVQQRYVNTGGTLFVGIDSSTGAGFGANYGAQFWHSGNYPISFGTNNQERMRITSAGLVGIGTNNPQENLDVTGNIRVSVNQQFSSSAYVYSYAGGTSNQVRVGAYLDGTNNVLQLITSQTERMRIDSSGNVLVGATAVRGGASTRMLVSSASATNYLEIQNTSAAGASGDADILFSSGSTGAYGLVGYNFTDDALRFFTNSTEKMRIDSAGNVGLSVTPPTLGGTVNTGALVSFSYILSRSAGGGTDTTSLTTNASYNGTNWLYRTTASAARYDQYTGYHAWSTAPSGTAGGTATFTERMRINRTGEVGIGTVASGVQLDIDAGSNSAIQATQTSLTALQLISTDAGASGMNIQYFKDSASPAASDSLTLVRSFGRSSTGVQREYSRVTTNIISPTNAAENGQWIVFVMASGTITNKLQINNNSIRAIDAYTLTTGSAANMNVDTAGVFSRSTSSIKYKTQVEDLAEPNSANIYNMRPVWYRSTCEKDNKNWSYYGLIAEELAEIDPRLVHWGYGQDQYEINYIETDGQKEEVKTLKEDAELQPEGVQYDRLTVLLIQEMKALKAQVESLKAEVQALKAP